MIRISTAAVVSTRRSRRRVRILDHYLNNHCRHVLPAGAASTTSVRSSAARFVSSPAHDSSDDVTGLHDDVDSADSRHFDFARPQQEQHLRRMRDGSQNTPESRKPRLINQASPRRAQEPYGRDRSPTRRVRPQRPPSSPPSSVNEQRNEVMRNFFVQGRFRQQDSLADTTRSGSQPLPHLRSWDLRGVGGLDQGNSRTTAHESLSRLAQTIRDRSAASPKSATTNPRHDPVEALRRKVAETTTGPRNRIGTLKKPASVLNKQRYRGDTNAGSNVEDSTEKLRAALFGNRKKNEHHPSSSRWRSPAPKSKVNASPSGAKTSSDTDFSSPLSDFIRRIQLEQAERQAELAKKQEKEVDEFGEDKVGSTPFPQWRLSTENNRLRDMRQRQRLQQQQRQQQQQDADAVYANEWGQNGADVTKKPVFVDPKDQVVVLPAYDVSLSEASLIFREKTSSLRRLLRNMGLIQRRTSDEEVSLDLDALELIALELGQKFERPTRRVIPKDEDILLQRRSAAEQDAVLTVREDNETGAETRPYELLPSRPPVVCIMGHVDHGKTTLMDALRRRSQEQSGLDKKKKGKGKKAKKGQMSSGNSSDVAGTEAGGITQAISAFQVPLAGQDEAAVTFLDTPGHAAFRAMRQSGSDAADIIVLVIAADDGVSPQTIEILNFYKSLVKGAGSGGINMVVAMNKIDKPGVDIQESRYRIESQLLEHGIHVEGMPSSEESEFGPPVQLIPVSGLTGDGLDDLIEGLALQSEVMDLRADDAVRAEGIVMDARVEKGLGIVADCIIRWGSLSKGDVVVSGSNSGKVRILKDMSDKPLKQGLPSQPVRIVGFDSVPKAGDPIICVESEELAEDLVNRRKALAASSEDQSSAYSGDVELQSAGKHMMHDDWKEAIQRKHGLETDSDGSLIRIPVVVKADADGTLAAILDALVQVGEESSHNVVVEPVRVGVGPVLASDVQMAKEGGATIVCFNIKNEFTIEKLAEEEGVPLVGSKVIYSLLDDAKKEFAAYLPPEPVEVIHGRATVQATYEIGGISDKVAGLQVTEGTLFKDKTKGTEGGTISCHFRVVRGGKVVSAEALRATTLKHFKDDVSEIGRGKECGLALSGQKDYQTGDVIECFSVEMKREFI